MAAPAHMRALDEGTDLGIVRMGARSKGKRLTIRCPGPGCDGKLRWAQVMARDPGWVPPT